MDRTFAAPPPGAVHEWAMCGVHQSNHRMIRPAGKCLRLDKARQCLSIAGGYRDNWRVNRRSVARIGGEIDPDQAILLASGVIPDANGADLDVLVLQHRRDMRALSFGRKPPTVIGAFHISIAEAAGRKRRGAMRANVAQSKNSPVLRAPQQYRFAAQ